MKSLNKVRIYCQAYYVEDVEIPDEMTFEQAEEYVKDNVAEIPLTELNWIPDSDEFDEMSFADAYISE